MDSKRLWDDIFSVQEWGKYPAEALIRFVARNFYKKDRNSIKILEVGCGPGPNIWYIAREGFNAYGIDISGSAIEKAKSRLKAEGLSADLRVGDIKQLPYEDKSFDAVIDNECLYCNNRKDTETVLKEIKRVLKDSGSLFSRTFSDGTYTGITKRTVGKDEYDDV
ncbi:MAG: class I SAM-dependent methyltransferase, partial [Candidatus Margulisiibacteriota bacterium]